MGQSNEALKTALDAARKLPLNVQRQLAEKLFEATEAEQNTLTLRLKKLPEDKSARLAILLDKSNQGTLKPAEGRELAKLALEADELMLVNSAALARAVRPELFDLHGRLIRARFETSIILQSPASRRVRRRNTER